MTKREALQLFEEKKVRTVWDDVEEKWYFSIVDVCGVLTDSPNPRNYWKVLKHRLVKEGNETVTNCNQLKLRADDGKMRLTIDMQNDKRATRGDSLFENWAVSIKPYPTRDSTRIARTYILTLQRLIFFVIFQINRDFLLVFL